MTPITGRMALLSFIDAQKKLQGLSDAELLRRAGMCQNQLANFRNDQRRGLQMSTMIALVNTLGFELVPVASEVVN